MTDIAERYERTSAQFTERVRAVPAAGWNNPSPCEGWTARDIVRHLTEWIPAFFGARGVEFPDVPSVDDDPVGACDPDQLQRMVASIGAMPEEVMRADGMFGPRLEVPADADDQTKFLAYVGRRAGPPQGP